MSETTILSNRITMTPFAMKYYNVAAAIAVAQPSLLRALASDSWSPKWPGNKGQCAVDPQPGYNFTVCITTPILPSLALAV